MRDRKNVLKAQGCQVQLKMSADKQMETKRDTKQTDTITN